MAATGVGHRTHRGHPRSDVVAVRFKCAGRRHQHHHQESGFGLDRQRHRRRYGAGELQGGQREPATLLSERPDRVRSVGPDGLRLALQAQRRPLHRWICGQGDEGHHGEAGMEAVRQPDAGTRSHPWGRRQPAYGAHGRSGRGAERAQLSGALARPELGRTLSHQLIPDARERGNSERQQLLRIPGQLLQYQDGASARRPHGHRGASTSRRRQTTMPADSRVPAT